MAGFRYSQHDHRLLCMLRDVTNGKRVPAGSIQELVNRRWMNLKKGKKVAMVTRLGERELDLFERAKA